MNGRVAPNLYRPATQEAQVTAPLDPEGTELLRALVAAGATIEQRLADGQPTATPPQHVIALARDTCDITAGDPPQVWLRPVYGPDRYDHGTPVFDGPHHEPRPIPCVRIDRIDRTVVGIAHADGSYSKVEAATGDLIARIDEWDNGRVEH